MTDPDLPPGLKYGVYAVAAGCAGVAAISLLPVLTQFLSGLVMIYVPFPALTRGERLAVHGGIGDDACHVIGRVLAAILGELGLDAAATRLLQSDDALVGASRKRMSSARRDMAAFGVQGVPNLIVSDSETRRLVSGGALFGDPGPLLASLRKS